jgi:hypothetical protein
MGSAGSIRGGEARWRSQRAQHRFPADGAAEELGLKRYGVISHWYHEYLSTHQTAWENYQAALGNLAIAIELMLKAFVAKRCFRRLFVGLPDELDVLQTEDTRPPKSIAWRRASFSQALFREARGASSSSSSEYQRSVSSPSRNVTSATRIKCHLGPGTAQGGLIERN